MTATATMYQSFSEYSADGTFDLDGNTFKVTLHSSGYTPNFATHTVYADLTNELSTANGYTSGGKALTGVTWTRTGGTTKLDADDTVWSASGGSIVARYAVVRAVGALNGVTDPLIMCVLLDDTPANKTATDAHDFSLVWSASGIVSAAV